MGSSCTLKNNDFNFATMIIRATGFNDVTSFYIRSFFLLVCEQFCFVRYFNVSTFDNIIIIVILRLLIKKGNARFRYLIFIYEFKTMLGIELI